VNHAPLIEEFEKTEKSGLTFMAFNVQILICSLILCMGPIFSLFYFILFYLTLTLITVNIIIIKSGGSMA
jgi:hypothetical protein